MRERERTSSIRYLKLSLPKVIKYIIHTTQHILLLSLFFAKKKKQFKNIESMHQIYNNDSTRTSATANKKRDNKFEKRKIYDVHRCWIFTEPIVIIIIFFFSFLLVFSLTAGNIKALQNLRHTTNNDNN